ncbi:ribonuclease III [Bosea sp. Root381]|jgi:glycosyltransferase involved in cell wall biosynthesis|nr:ribonuclease III [Bosea sp. Root381]
MRRLSIVVPVYRSETVLNALVDQIAGALAGSRYEANFEIVLVNDCSPDSSWRVIERLSEDRPFVRGISLRRNAGQHNATMAGLNHATGDIVVIMDDDLQHPPSAILQIVKKIEDGHDVCYTNYRGRKHATWKQWGSRLNDWMATRLLDKPAGLYLSSFKAIDRGVVDEIIRYDGPYTYIDGLILSATGSITSVDIDHQDRFAGESGYNFRRLVSLWLKMVTGSSILPLRAASLLGFILALLSFLMFAVVVVERLSSPGIPPGWASILAAIFLSAGINLVCLGVMGEYIGRIYARTNNVSQFVVGKKTF